MRDRTPSPAFGAELAAGELHTILDSLDRHGLHPERAAHALRVTQLRSLGETCAAGAPARDLTCSAVGAPSAPGELRWCSFKKRLCDCRRGGAPASAAAPIYALDCEFTPLRCVVLDATGATRLDCLVAPASREQRLLKVDRAELPLLPASEVQSALRDLLAGDGLLVGHTPQRDLQALGLVGDAALPADRIVDVAALAPAVDAPPAAAAGGAAARPRKASAAGAPPAARRRRDYRFARSRPRTSTTATACARAAARTARWRTRGPLSGCTRRSDRRSFVNVVYSHSVSQGQDAQRGHEAHPDARPARPGGLRLDPRTDADARARRKPRFGGRRRRVRGAVRRGGAAVLLRPPAGLDGEAGARAKNLLHRLLPAAPAAPFCRRRRARRAAPARAGGRLRCRRRWSSGGRRPPVRRTAAAPRAWAKRWRGGGPPPRAAVGSRRAGSLAAVARRAAAAAARWRRRRSPAAAAGWRRAAWPRRTRSARIAPSASPCRRRRASRGGAPICEAICPWVWPSHSCCTARL